MIQIENFDALGVLSTDEVRSLLSRKIPSSHYQNIVCIAYRPEAFVGTSSGTIGLYRRSTREILVNANAYFGLESALQSMKSELNSSPRVTDRLSDKRSCSEDVSDRFLDAANKILRTLYHEIGHHVYDAKIKADADLSARWQALYQQSHDFVTEYARTSPEENFAECYMCYVDDKRQLAARQFIAECNEMASLF